jgi:hypothetical protein
MSCVQAPARRPPVLLPPRRALRTGRPREPLLPPEGPLPGRRLPPEGPPARPRPLGLPPEARALRRRGLPPQRDRRGNPRRARRPAVRRRPWVSISSNEYCACTRCLTAAYVCVCTCVFLQARPAPRRRPQLKTTLLLPHLQRRP